VEGRKGLIASTRVFHTRNCFMEVVATKFQGTPLPPRASGGAPSSRISGINSTLCYIQIRAVEFFRYNEILPGAPPASLPTGGPPPPLPLPQRVPCSLHDARGSSSLHYRKLRNAPECHFLFIIMLMPRWPLLSSCARAITSHSASIDAFTFVMTLVMKRILDAALFGRGRYRYRKLETLQVQRSDANVRDVGRDT